MSGTVVSNIVAALLGVIITALVAVIIAREQLHVMREQLITSQAQTAAAKSQANAANDQIKLTLLEPIVLFWADLLTPTRLKNRDEAGVMPSAHWRQIRMTLSGPKVARLSELTDDYIIALRRYADRDMSFEEIDQLREKTIADINTLIGVTL